MAEIINLKRARKAKDRAERDKTAQANRIAHGTPKAARKFDKARNSKLEKDLSQKKLED
jgi:hypothetical protein